MLIPFTTIKRRSASEEPIKMEIGIDPNAIARVESGMAEGTVTLYADGSDAPYTIVGEVEDVILYVNSFCIEQVEIGEEVEKCEPQTTDTE